MQHCPLTIGVAIAFLTVAAAERSAAQSGRPATPTPNQTVYLEFGGTGGFLSANLDRKLNDVIALRVGTGWWMRPGSFALFEDEYRPTQRAVLRPLMVSFLSRIAPGSAHRIEGAAGVVFASRSDLTEPQRKAQALGVLIGYRWMAPPAMVRLAVYHNAVLAGAFPFSGLRPGMSFGRSF
jgi:hypothetical protein